METGFKISVLGLAFVLTACGGGQEEIDADQTAVVDTASTGMPAGAMSGSMGSMAGMGPGMMGSQWEQHMAAMHAAAGDSLQGMMPMHRQMASRMMEMMDGQMGMAMDSTWMATRDSLRHDLGRMEDMTPAELERFMEEHDARMQRMLQMHQSAPGQTPPQQ